MAKFKLKVPKVIKKAAKTVAKPVVKAAKSSALRKAVGGALMVVPGGQVAGAGVLAANAAINRASSVKRAVSSLARNPTLKRTAAGPALIAQRGAAAAAGMGADAALRAAKQGSTIAKRVIGNTLKLAQKGSPGAQRAAGLIGKVAKGLPSGQKALAAKAAGGKIGVPVEGYLVTPDGHFVRGRFSQVD